MKDEIYNFLEALAATAIIAALVWLCMIATPCQMSGEYDLALEEMRQAQ